MQRNGLNQLNIQSRRIAEARLPGTHDVGAELFNQHRNSPQHLRAQLPIRKSFNN